MNEYNERHIYIKKLTESDNRKVSNPKFYFDYVRKKLLTRITKTLS